MPKNGVEKQLADTCVHGSFVLADVEFALPAHAIQEVVNEPSCYEPFPLAPNYALGLLNLRGLIIPVVDLRILYNLQATSDDTVTCSKIAIVEQGNSFVGLLFSETRDVFNASLVDQYTLDTNSIDTTQRTLKGVFKLDNGNRIVHILDVAALFNLEGFPKTRVRDNAVTDAKKRVRRQCISYVVNDNRFAFDINAVKEIISFDGIDNTVFSSSLCLGAIDLRSKMVPVVKFDELAGINTTESLVSNKRVIILQDDAYLLGLLVDSIESIVTYYEDELIRFPKLGNDTQKLFEGSLPEQDKQPALMIVNHTSLLADSDILEITRGHVTLFQPNSDQSDNELLRVFDWHTYITFSLDAIYALKISHVKEVIPQPEDLLAAPISCPHIKGMFNLRGEMVTLIDSLSLCPKIQDVEPGNDMYTKVLVYESGGVVYGLLVRSVDSIVKQSDKELLQLPDVITNSANDDNWNIKNAVKSAIKVDDRMISILDLDCITANVGS